MASIHVPGNLESGSHYSSGGMRYGEGSLVKKTVLHYPVLLTAPTAVHVTAEAIVLTRSESNGFLGCNDSLIQWNIFCTQGTSENILLVNSDSCLLPALSAPHFPSL